MKIRIRKCSTSELLEAEVNYDLSEGWKFHGGVFVHNYSWCQAMTKGDYIRPARLKKNEKV